MGDLVLTHKKRFRKVYGLPRRKRQKPEVVRLYFDRQDKTVTMTENHPVRIINGRYSRWIPAKYIKPGMSVQYLANECARCKKLTPFYKKYCCRSCLSKDITDRQWANPEHRKNISEKAREQLKREYRLGLRDKDRITDAANKKTREMVEEGVFGWWMNEEFFDKVRKATNTPEHREAQSRRMKENNPMEDPDVRQRATESLVNTLENHPEKRLNARMAEYRKSQKRTYIEERMENLLNKMGVDYAFQYPILRYDVDFALPELGIAIECDGKYWHQDKDKEKKRDERIKEQGWDIFHFTGSEINNQITQVEDQLIRIIGNHTKQFHTISMEVQKVESWKLDHPRTLYNLSVEEDESYIANGVIVHNCRCIILPARPQDIPEDVELLNAEQAQNIVREARRTGEVVSSVAG